MDRELIERLAKEAGGMRVGYLGSTTEMVLCGAEIDLFAAKVAEECAKVCEGLDGTIGGGTRADFFAECIREAFQA